MKGWEESGMMDGNMSLLEGWAFRSSHLRIKHWLLPKPLCQEINVIVYHGFLVSPSVSIIFCLFFFFITKLKNIETLRRYVCLQNLQISSCFLNQVSWQNLLEPTMVQGKNDGMDKDMVLPLIQQRPAVRALPAWLSLIVFSVLHVY